MTRPIESPVQIDARLEGILNAVPDALASDVMVVCHPHPLHEGTMHNKVVTTLCRMARDQGLPSLRFNFRGVQGSAGEWDSGIGEIDDGCAAVEFMQDRYPGARIWLAGFSFGGYVAAHVAQREDIAGIMLIAPATSRFDMDSIRIQIPGWMGFNRDDDTVDPASMQAWLNRQDSSLIKSFIQDQGGHFYHGQLGPLKRQAQAWLEEQL